MSSRGPGYLKQIWYKWKTLKLPWRTQYLVGADLSGNTFWEFKDALNANRLRRIVKYSRKAHFADVKISPQWHQWLRHTRDEAPSIQEQQYDVSRQAMMKQLAAKADERWRSAPSYLDAPNKQQPLPGTNITDSRPSIQENVIDDAGQGSKSAVGDQDKVAGASSGQHAQQGAQKRGTRRRQEDNPFQSPQRGAPSENWQPESWKPGVAARR